MRLVEVVRCLLVLTCPGTTVKLFEVGREPAEPRPDLGRHAKLAVKGIPEGTGATEPSAHRPRPGLFEELHGQGEQFGVRVSGDQPTDLSLQSSKCRLVVIRPSQLCEVAFDVGVEAAAGESRRRPGLKNSDQVPASARCRTTVGPGPARNMQGDTRLCCCAPGGPCNVQPCASGHGKGTPGAGQTSIGRRHTVMRVQRKQAGHTC